MPLGPSHFNTGQLADYSQEINIIPNQFGYINQKGLFTSEGVSSRVVILDKTEESISVLPAVEWGGPATVASQQSDDMLPLIIPHFPHDDFMKPEEVQDRRRPGDTGPETIERRRLKKMQAIRRRQAQTLEWLRLGAIKGVILDGSGNTIYNLYNQFGITKKQIDFDLGTAGTDVKAKIREVKRWIELNTFSGGLIGSIECIVSPTFFDKLVNHPDVVEAFQYYQATNGLVDPNRMDLRSGFRFQGMTFIEYNGSVNYFGTGTNTPLIAANTGHAFPLGVEDMFVNYFGPANHFDYVNTEGQELYLFEWASPKGDRIELMSQMNPLPICRRPQALVEVITTT